MKKISRRLSFLVAGLSLIGLACAAAPKRVVYRDGEDRVQIRSSLVSDFASPGSSRAVSRAGLNEALGRVRYSRALVTTLAWSRPVRVFSARQSGLLARILSEALVETGPGEEIAFSLRGEGRQKSRVTQGAAFWRDGRLCLFLERIGQSAYRPADDPFWGRPERWKLVAGRGQEKWSPQGRQGLLLSVAESGNVTE